MGTPFEKDTIARDARLVSGDRLSYNLYVRYLFLACLFTTRLAAQNDSLAACEQQFGKQSADYGLCLLKAGDAEHKLSHAKETQAHYTEAVRLLKGRSETADALMYLGVVAIGQKRYPEAEEYLTQAQSLNSSLTGPVEMWRGLLHDCQDQFEEADNHYKAALDAGSSNPVTAIEALELYSRFLSERGRADEARAIEVRLSTMRASNPSIPAAVKPPASSGVYRVGGAVTPPSVIRKAEPPYTEEARVAKYSGKVLVETVVGADGKAHDTKVIRKLGFGLDEQAIAAIEGWEFKPGEKGGVPVPVFATVEVSFRLL
jgi:TonB family protein